MSENQKAFAAFLAKKDIVFSAKRYGIDAFGRNGTGLVCIPADWDNFKNLGAAAWRCHSGGYRYLRAGGHRPLPWQFPSAMR